MSSTDDYIPVSKPNWLEFARNYHSIAAQPNYRVRSENQFRRSVKNGTEQVIRSPDYKPARNSPSNDTPSGHPVGGVGVGSDQGMCPQTGGWSTSPTGDSGQEQHELAWLDWIADATSNQ